jgi:hypothetical protein
MHKKKKILKGGLVIDRKIGLVNDGIKTHIISNAPILPKKNTQLVRSKHRTETPSLRSKKKTPTVSPKSDTPFINPFYYTENNIKNTAEFDSNPLDILNKYIQANPTANITYDTISILLNESKKIKEETKTLTDTPLDTELLLRLSDFD